MIGESGYNFKHEHSSLTLSQPISRVPFELTILNLLSAPPRKSAFGNIKCSNGRLNLLLYSVILTNVAWKVEGYSLRGMS